MRPEKQDKLPPLRLSAKRKADKKLVEEVGIRQGKKTERKDTTTATSRSTSTGASSSDNHREQEERPVQVPDHWIVLKEASVKYPKRVVVKVALTEVKSVSEVELQVSKVYIYMHNNYVMDNLLLYDVIGGGKVRRINFMLGTFHQPKSTLHKKVTSAVTKTVSQSQFCTC